MNKKAKQIHDANATRIRSEREAMLARWANTHRFSLPVNFNKRRVAVARGEAEIPRVQKIARNCLRCETSFMSAGPGNRLCLRCSHLSEGICETAIGNMPG